MKLTQQILKDLIHYEPLTGVFTRKVDSGSAKKGDLAGCFRRNPRRNTGYMRFMVRGKAYISHRLAWFYMTGEWPEQMDHINGDGIDNRWKNLRSVTAFQNQRNVPLRKTNKSGIHGVRWVARENKFATAIGADKKQHYLGGFESFLEACCARKSAENKYGFHANHGRVAS